MSVHRRFNKVRDSSICVIVTTISEPRFQFAGGFKIFFRRGKPLKLTCTIKSVDLQEEVAWYHNETLITPNQTHTQSMSSRKSCLSPEDEDCLFESSFDLAIEAADWRNSGIYRCKANNTQESSTYVEIFGGEYRLRILITCECNMAMIAIKTMHSLRIRRASVLIPNAYERTLTKPK